MKTKLVCRHLSMVFVKNIRTTAKRPLANGMKMVKKKPEWLSVWMRDDRNALPATGDAAFNSRFSEKILDQIKIGCHTTDKNMQARALFCWKLWINEQTDWKQNHVCFEAVEPLTLKKFYLLCNDLQLCLTRLKLFQLLINKIDCSVNNCCEGSAYVLQAITESCLMWLSCKEMDKQIHRSVIKFLCQFFKQEVNRSCHSTHRTRVQSSAGKFYSRLLDKFLNAFPIMWDNLENKTDFICLWTFVLELSERYFESISTLVWHEILKLVRRISSDRNQDFQVRLTFLHSCATTLKSVMNSSKYSDSNVVDTSPSEQLLHLLVEMCGGHSDRKCGRECFSLCEETCRVLSKYIMHHRGDVASCTSLLAKLDDTHCGTCRWALWTGMVESFQVTTAPQASGRDKFYRKARGIAVNFVLDEADLAALDAKCIEMVKNKTVDILGCACFVHFGSECLVDRRLNDTPDARSKRLSGLANHLVAIVSQNLQFLNGNNFSSTSDVVDCSKHASHRLQFLAPRDNADEPQRRRRREEIAVKKNVSVFEKGGTSGHDRNMRVVLRFQDANAENINFFRACGKTKFLDFKSSSGKIELLKDENDITSCEMHDCDTICFRLRMFNWSTRLQLHYRQVAWTWWLHQLARSLRAQLVKNRRVTPKFADTIPGDVPKLGSGRRKIDRCRNRIEHPPHNCMLTTSSTRSICAIVLGIHGYGSSDENVTDRSNRRPEKRETRVATTTRQLTRCGKRKREHSDQRQHVRLEVRLKNFKSDENDVENRGGKTIFVAEKISSGTQEEESENMTTLINRHCDDRRAFGDDSIGANRDREPPSNVIDGGKRKRGSRDDVPETRAVENGFLDHDGKHDSESDGIRGEASTPKRSSLDRLTGVDVGNNRASRMLALLSNSPPARRVANHHQQQQSPGNKRDSPSAEREKKTHLTSYVKTARASRLLALVNRDGNKDAASSAATGNRSLVSAGRLEIDRRHHDFPYHASFTPTTGPAVVAADKSATSTPPKKKSIRFDDDKNETMVFLTDSPPAEFRRTFRRCCSKT